MIGRGRNRIPVSRIVVFSFGLATHLCLAQEVQVGDRS